MEFVYQGTKRLKDTQPTKDFRKALKEWRNNPKGEIRMKRTEPSNEAKFNGYLRRMLWRIIKLSIPAFILFSIIMVLIWAIPKMINWAT